MSVRKIYFFLCLIVVLLLAFSLYLQYFQQVIPCPLCTMQRFTFVLIGILAAVGFLASRYFWARMIINSFLILSSLLGILLAGRQVWLQNFPSLESNECGVTLEYMAEVLPIKELVQKILQGSAECSVNGWEFLYLNMAEWSLIWFVLFLIVSLHLFLKEIKYSH